METLRTKNTLNLNEVAVHDTAWPTCSCLALSAGCLVMLRGALCLSMLKARSHVLRIMQMRLGRLRHREHSHPLHGKNSSESEGAGTLGHTLAREPKLLIQLRSPTIADPVRADCCP